VLQVTNREVEALHAEMRSVGAWIFSGGLHWPSTSTMLTPGVDDVAAVEGPFAEGTEGVSGIVVIHAADSMAALDWDRRLARATKLPIEVRAFQNEGDSLG